MGANKNSFQFKTSKRHMSFEDAESEIGGVY